jgi:hypothetical protein
MSHFPHTEDFPLLVYTMAQFLDRCVVFVLTIAAPLLSSRYCCTRPVNLLEIQV